MVRKMAEEGGLTLTGNVVARFKRFVRTKDNGDESEVVTYRVLAGTAVHEVDVWAPTGYYPVGSYVQLRVFPTAFQARGGGVKVRLSVEREADGFHDDVAGVVQD